MAAAARCRAGESGNPQRIFGSGKGVTSDPNPVRSGPVRPPPPFSNRFPFWYVLCSMLGVNTHQSGPGLGDIWHIQHQSGYYALPFATLFAMLFCFVAREIRYKKRMDQILF